MVFHLSHYFNRSIDLMVSYIISSIHAGNESSGSTVASVQKTSAVTLMVMHACISVVH